MFMNQKSILIVVITALLFVCFVNSSNTDFKFRIVEFPSDTEAYSYGGYPYHDAYLKTSEPYLWVEWWVNDKLIDIDWGDGVKKEAYFWPNDTTPGTIKGKKHKIEAFVAFTDVEDVDWDWLPWNWEYMWDVLRFMDSDSYTVRMFEPKVISGTKNPVGVPENKLGKGIYGYVQLTRHYHKGRNIVVDGNLYAHNRTKVAVHAASWYRHTRFAIDDGRTLWTIEDTYPSGQLLSGKTYSNSGSSMISFPVETEGGNIGKDQRIKLNAHLHLQVGGQVWHEEDNAWTHTFTYKDNESYEEGD